MIKKNIVHGFELPVGKTKVSDTELLDIDNDQITMLMEKLSYKNYHRWKLKQLRKILSERVEESQWTDEVSQQRIDMTMRSIRHTEDILSRWEEI